MNAAKQQNGKLDRQGILQALVEVGRFRTQEELAEELARRGVRATPATVSRDLKELGYVKSVGGSYSRSGRNGGSAGPAGSTSEALLRRLLLDLPISVDQAANLMVLKTLPGFAHSVASGLDGCGWPEVVGTVAGDDTIFVALRDPADGARFRGHLQTLTGRTVEPPADASPAVAEPLTTLPRPAFRTGESAGSR